MVRYLTFIVNTRELAVPLDRVLEISEMLPVAHVPSLPDAIAGVVNVRGDVVPVLDLAVRFGAPPKPDSRRTCLVLVDMTRGEECIRMALRVDTVESIVDLTPEETSPVPPFGVPIPLEFLAGVGTPRAGIVLLLDLDRVLSLDDLVAVGGALEAEVAAPPPE
jgi:purine-binding chemotaxis protein CheW